MTNPLALLDGTDEKYMLNDGTHEKNMLTAPDQLLLGSWSKKVTEETLANIKNLGIEL